MKIITNNSFTVAYKMPGSVLVVILQGSYEFKNGIYTERIEYSAMNPSAPVVENTFKSEIKDGLWYIKNDQFDQVWRRRKEYK